MPDCTFCGEEELLPFTCRYCSERFCRRHHLPENHNCKGLTREKWLSKKHAEDKKSGLADGDTPSNKTRIYQIPGVKEVIERARGQRHPKSDSSHFNVDEKRIALLILLSIIILGILSRMF